MKLMLSMRWGSLVKCRIRRLVVPCLLSAIIAVLFGWCCIFQVDQNEIATVMSLGRLVPGPACRAGLSFKWPWQSVRRLDRRISVLECERKEKFTGEHEPVVIQPMVCWRIDTDRIGLFLQTCGDETTAAGHLGEMVWACLDHALARHPLIDWLNDCGDGDPNHRAAMAGIMNEVYSSCREDVRRKMGVEVVDIYPRRLARPTAMNDLLHNRMATAYRLQAESVRQAAREQAAERVRQVQHEADQLLAVAESKGEEIRDQSQKEVSRIYSEARRLNPELAALIRKLENYRKLLRGNTTLILGGDLKIFMPATSPAPH